MAAFKFQFFLLAFAVLATFLFAYCSAQDGKCPCPKGQCCSKYGYCGKGTDYCGKNNCASQCNNGCFPGDALVYLSTGKTKPMNELSVGDKVAVSDGKYITPEEIYAFGRKDSQAVSEVIKLEMVGDDNTKTLELTSEHFVPVMSSDGQFIHKRARDVKTGDILTASNASLHTTIPYIISGISKVDKDGLYKPYTTSGNLIVNDVTVSCHSDWFLDGIFDALKITHMLPAAYQVVLLPARLLYKTLGKDMFAAVYNKLDSNLDIAVFGTMYGGKIAVTAAMAAMYGLYKVSTKYA